MIRAAERAAQKQGTRATQSKPLSEDSIVAAALSLIRRKGAKALTMRDLADELGVSSTGPYYHIKNKAGLLALIADNVYGAVEVPPPSAGSWDQRLRTLLRSMREVVERYDGLSDAVYGVDSAQVRRLEDAQLRLLLEAGFPPDRAVPALRVLMGWTSGHARIELLLRDPKRRRPRSRWTEAQRLIDDDESLQRLHGDDYFDFGLDAILAGLRSMLDAHPAEPRTDDGPTRRPRSAAAGIVGVSAGHRG